MTLSIDDKLYKKMEEMQEVNWSAVAREAISRYIQTRSSPELGELVEELTTQKNRQYSDGAKAAIDFAKTYGYETLAPYFELYDNQIVLMIAPLGQTENEFKINSFYDLFAGSTLKRNPPKEYKRGFYDTMMKLKESVHSE